MMAWTGPGTTAWLLVSLQCVFSETRCVCVCVCVCLGTGGMIDGPGTKVLLCQTKVLQCETGVCLRTGMGSQDQGMSFSFAPWLIGREQVASDTR